MARILKPGVKPEDRLYRGECRRCGCIAEWQANEIVYPDRTGATAEAECPHCKGKVGAINLEEIKPPIDPWERREFERFMGRLTMTNTTIDPRHAPMRPFPYGPGIDAARKGRAQ